MRLLYVKNNQGRLRDPVPAVKVGSSELEAVLLSISAKLGLQWHPAVVIIKRGGRMQNYNAVLYLGVGHSCLEYVHVYSPYLSSRPSPPISADVCFLLVDRIGSCFEMHDRYTSWIAPWGWGIIDVDHFPC